MFQSNSTFLVHQTTLQETKFSESPAPNISTGEVLFKVEKYFLSSNNITYALIGHKMKYWHFFPTDAPFGIIPVWGFAKVVASKSESVALGDRFFGYLPMSTFLKVSVGKNTPQGFSDQSKHRAALPALYNFYTKADAVGKMQEKQENYGLITRTLFPTAFLLYQFLKDANFYKAEQVLLSSASSKTALGLAYLLRKNQEGDGKKIIGLTSPGNVDFVRSTGYYDQVIAYPDLEQELSPTPSVFFDLAGNAQYLYHLQDLLQDQLAYACRVGFTHWDAPPVSTERPPTPVFSTAEYLPKVYQKWGIAKTHQLIMTELAAYSQNMAAWMALSKIEDQEALAGLYQDLLQGKADPQKGYIVQFPA